MRAQNQMSNTLGQIQAKQSESDPDPMLVKQKTDLLASLRHNNRILTIQNAPKDLEGTEGWKTLLSQCSGTTIKQLNTRMHISEQHSCQETEKQPP